MCTSMMHFTSILAYSAKSDASSHNFLGVVTLNARPLIGIGSDIAPPDVKAKICNYPELGRAAQRAIPGSDLIEFAGLGHAPQMEEPTKFNQSMVRWLSK